MEIEDIAKMDLCLRLQDGRQNLLYIDALIIADNDPQSVNKLKEAAYKLHEIEGINASEEIKQTWNNLFTKQVRYSVTRAKDKRKTKTQESLKNQEENEE